MNKLNSVRGKIRQSEHVFAVKIKTESNGFGTLKTFIVLFLIALQVCFLILTHLNLMTVFTWFLSFSIIISLIACIHVLSSNSHGQVKATWILFLIVCFGFGYIFYFMSDKRVMFRRANRKYKQIIKQVNNLNLKNDYAKVENLKVKNDCDYLYNTGKFLTYTNSKSKYFSSGTKLYDSILEDLKKAKDFIFIEYYIISNGVLFQRIFDILRQKAKEGVDIRIIYDDMGSHGTLKRKTKKELKKNGIKLKPFNQLVPIFNLALNLRNHRKIVIIDGKIGYTGGANLADEYINEKRLHGYWKDSGIKIEGNAIDNLTLPFLIQWQFVSNEKVDFKKYLNKSNNVKTNEVLVPFVSGPNYDVSISQGIFCNLISNSKEKLYIMTPYFIPDETIINLLKNRALSGVDVRIILPEVADKNFVYIVSRNNAEKLMQYGIKLYTMKSSFVHAKVVLTENSAVVGSINMDLRSFYQQFESAVYVSITETLKEINDDFENTFNHSVVIDEKNKKRNKLYFRILAGLLNLISPFM